MWKSVLRSALLMLGAVGLGSATPALLYRTPDGSMEIRPLKRLDRNSILQTIQELSSRKQAQLTLQYGDPNDLVCCYGGTDPADTFVTWFQCPAGCNVVSYTINVVSVSANQEDFYTFAAHPSFIDYDSLIAPWDSGTGIYVDYHYGTSIGTEGISPVGTKFFEQTDNILPDSAGHSILKTYTLSTPVDVQSNPFLIGYVPNSGTNGNSAPGVPIWLGNARNIGRWHSLVYQGDFGSFGVPAGWYANWHDYAFYVVVDLYENPAPFLSGLTRLSDTYDRDGPFTISVQAEDIGVPLDSTGVDTVYLVYRVNSGAETMIEMTRVAGDSANGTYEGTVDFSASPLSPGDTVYYRVEAVDMQGARRSTLENAFVIRAQQGQVLAIFEDGLGAAESTVVDLLNGILSGYSKQADVWDVAQYGLPDGSVITASDPQWSQPYEAIIFVGWAGNTVAADSTLFAQYLDNGGALFVSSQDLFAGGFGYAGYGDVYTTSPGEFVYDYLNVGEFMDDYVGTDPQNGGLTQNTDTLIGVVSQGGPLSSSAVTLPDTVYSYFAGNMWTPYVLSADGLSDEFLYPTPDGFATSVFYDANTFKSAYTGLMLPYFVNPADTTPATGVINGVLLNFLAWVTGVEEGLSPQARSLQLAVKPGVGALTLSFALPTAGDVRLSLFDAMGREVRTLAKGRMEAGVHTVQVSTKDLAKGLYFVRLDAGSRQVIKRVPILR